MRQLNPDEVRQLQDGQQVHVKLSRVCEHGDHVAYEGPASLYVAHHPKTGEIVELTVRDPLDWAGADPRRDLMPDGALMVEDWLMEIFEP